MDNDTNAADEEKNIECVDDEDNVSHVYIFPLVVGKIRVWKKTVI